MYHCYFGSQSAFSVNLSVPYDMDLLCNEVDDCVKSEADSAILFHDRVFQRLLASEDRYFLPCNYFRLVQKEVNMPMRRICVTWMLEVCEEEKCEDAIFPLAVNYFDRFLSAVSISKSQLQLLGCVCLMLATKIRQCIPLDARRLASYADYSFEHTDILAWELLVLGRLKWDVASVLPVDYLELLISRLPTENLRPMVRKHALVFLELCTIEFKFCMWPASRVALGCVCAAVNGIDAAKSKFPTIKSLAAFFHSISGVEKLVIEQFTRMIEEQIAVHVLLAFEKQSTEKNSSVTVNSKAACNNHNAKDSSEQTPDTPTDVYDVIV